jgi:predicted amidophosphoribosyltransferase
MDSKGYDVLTPVEQAEIARTFLASERGPDWVCPRCKEKIDGAFDVCWKCGRERDEAWVSS